MGGTVDTIRSRRADWVRTRRNCLFQGACESCLCVDPSLRGRSSARTTRWHGKRRTFYRRGRWLRRCSVYDLGRPGDRRHPCDGCCTQWTFALSVHIVIIHCTVRRQDLPSAGVLRCTAGTGLMAGGRGKGRACHAGDLIAPCSPPVPLEISALSLHLFSNTRGGDFGTYADETLLAF